MIKRWKCFDQAQGLPNLLDDKSRRYCYFAREYISEGYTASDDNQLIFNFKKPTSRKHRSDWQYKKEAIKQFAQDLHIFFCNVPNQYLPLVLTTIPTSKRRDDENFDPRLDEMIKHLLKLGTDDNGKCRYRYEVPITIKNRMLSASAEHGSRDIEEKYNNYLWQGFKETSPKKLIVIDDVITTGSSFMAYKKRLQKECQSTVVYGLFWARTIHRSTGIAT